MSKRRQIGDRVWVREAASFGASRGEWATIIGRPSNHAEQLSPCCFNCGDDDCWEWNDLKSDDGRPFYHVSECEMFDGPQDNSDPTQHEPDSFSTLEEAEVKAILKKLGNDLAAGLCPICGAKIERKRQIGRSVYTEPCAHRLGQGFLAGDGGKTA